MWGVSLLAPCGDEHWKAINLEVASDGLFRFLINPKYTVHAGI